VHTAGKGERAGARALRGHASRELPSLDLLGDTDRFPYPSARTLQLDGFSIRRRIEHADEIARDPGLKAALEKAVAAHPGIARAKPYVLKHKLHEDREYLFEILFNVPLFKDAARSRLSILLGKDYGDDLDAWKKQK